MDNAGENLTFKNNCIENALQLDWEITALNTPQQNGIVQSAFRMLIGCARTIVFAANFGKGLKAKLWAEIISTVTKLDSILLPPDKDICSAKQF